jgi:hypothetical protein
MRSVWKDSGSSVPSPAIDDVRGVFFFAGFIVCLLGASMLVPAIVDLADNNDDYRVPDVFGDNDVWRIEQYARLHHIWQRGLYFINLLMLQKIEKAQYVGFRRCSLPYILQSGCFFATVPSSGHLESSFG